MVPHLLTAVALILHLGPSCGFNFTYHVEWDFYTETFVDQTTNFIQLFYDPYSNVVMNKVLQHISEDSCSKKIVSNYSADKMGSTSGTQYYVVFCDVLAQNVNHLTSFVVERQLKHGDGRYIFVTFLNNGSPYNSRYFIRDNDRFRLHYLFMIKYDGYGWSVASFYDPFTRRERPYTAGQDVEQVFSDQLRNVHGYHFSLEYGRLTFGSSNHIIDLFTQ
nr:uncharacterized protein LOC109401039 [Aedes albopictus]